MGIFKRFLSGEEKEPANPKLLRAMQRVSEGEKPKARQALYQELLKSTLLIPIEGELEGHEPGRWVTLSEGMDVAFVTARDSEGQVAFMAFTDPGTLRSWRPEGSRYVALGGPDLFALALNNDAAAILVNPAGPVGGEITRREIQMLAEGAVPDPETMDSSTAQVSMPQGTNLMIGAPAVPPAHELVDRLMGILDEQPEVSEAYIFQTVMGQGVPHLVIGIKLDGAVVTHRIDEIAQTIMDRIQPSLSPGEFVDLMILDREE